MNKQEVLEVIKKLKEGKKRKFSQSYDLIITLKNFNIKKAECQLEFFVPLHFSLGKKIKTCAIVGPELKAEADENCDTVIEASDIDAYASKKKDMKKLAEQHDYFIAQANFMGKLAGAFGRVLGPRGKMPNPKAGCVVPPKTNLKPLIDKLQKLVKVSTKKVPMIQVIVGREDMKDDEVADNIVTLYNNIVHHLPNEAN
ncbi:hypothetical protein KY328_03765, partial [Candidatus Woesearchaeota archaeon]|nr:hypothetical protein [Candidatus Woesearchaeota archaeon]